MAKLLKLSNDKEFYVCEGSTVNNLINVFHTIEEAEAFRENLTDELLTGATLNGEEMTHPLDDISTVEDPHSHNITASYFQKIPDPELEEGD